MKNGLRFQVNEIEYVVALCTLTRSGNAAILLQQTIDSEWLTVSNLTEDRRGGFSWDRGYPSENFETAVVDYLRIST